MDGQSQTNPANIVGGPSAEGRILSVECLPETGETPFLRWLLLGAVGLGLAAAGLLLARRQWQRP
ncbi:MAG TPA: hypothetical protein VHO69_19595 [Phototrophicaceae bacterium]|nr:hypothetical protein [Phototrophicaceae bacterium]